MHFHRVFYSAFVLVFSIDLVKQSKLDVGSMPRVGSVFRMHQDRIKLIVLDSQCCRLFYSIFVLICGLDATLDQIRSMTDDSKSAADRAKVVDALVRSCVKLIVLDFPCLFCVFSRLQCCLLHLSAIRFSESHDDVFLLHPTFKFIVYFLYINTLQIHIHVSCFSNIESMLCVNFVQNQSWLQLYWAGS
jgi:hypothetical protein